MQIVDPLSEHGATETAIAEFEQELGLRLPEEYRRFLAEINGGRPKAVPFVFRTPGGLQESVVEWFLTLHSDGAPYRLRDNIAIYDDRVPDKMLPIAFDPFGNLILLDLGARQFGSIWFWDHEEEGMDDPTWDNVFEVAQSFSALDEMIS